MGECGNQCSGGGGGGHDNADGDGASGGEGGGGSGGGGNGDTASEDKVHVSDDGSDKNCGRPKNDVHNESADHTNGRSGDRRCENDRCEDSGENGVNKTDASLAST